MTCPQQYNVLTRPSMHMGASVITRGSTECLLTDYYRELEYVPLGATQQVSSARGRAALISQPVISLGPARATLHN